MKTILVLLDGLGDRSYRELNFRTPLQAAATPNMDRLACLGGSGLFHASVPGQCLPSETAHYLLFGYDLHDFPGRGLLEAVGEEVPFADDDVLVLAHLSGITLAGDVPILTRGRADIKGSAVDIGRLLDALSPYETTGVKFRLYQTRRNDAILVLNGDVCPFVSDSDPMIKGQPMGQIVPLDENPEPEKAEKTAAAMNAYLRHCHRVLAALEQSPLKETARTSGANFLTTQRCGRRIPQVPFSNYWGFEGMLIASVSIYWGLAHELGLDYTRVEDSSDPGEDLRERIRLALKDDDHDFFHVHTKVPDEVAHTGSVQKKKAAIARLDQGLAELVDAVESFDDLLVIITADHSTPCISPMIHSGEPVPVIIAGPTVRRDDVQGFDEVRAASGCLGLLKGRELMLTILNYNDRSVLAGHNMGSKEKIFFPSRYEPFKIT